MGAKNTSKYTNYFKPNQTFGKYTIIDGIIIKGNNNNESKVNCLCDCGKINLVSCLSLIKGVSNGCISCTHNKTGTNHHSFKGYKEIPGSWFSRYSKNKKREFNITIEDIYNLWVKQNKKCSLSGLPIDFINTNSTSYDLSCTASLDRINSQKGYVLDNIQLVHKDVNMIKKHYTQEYFIYLCRLIATNKVE